MSRQSEKKLVLGPSLQLHGLRFATGIICLFAASVLTPQLLAQDSAAIAGTVTDPSGAVVAGASITGKNADTGLVRTSVTDNAGRYELFSLPVGLYEVHVKQPGFPEAIRS